MATPDRAEHDVLPRRLQRPPVAVVADQEGGGDGGGLDGDPEHAEVVGKHGQAHGAQEQATRAGYAAAVPGVELDVELRAGRGPSLHRSRSGRPDATTISMQADSASARSRPAGGRRRPSVEHGGDQHQPRDQDDGGTPATAGVPARPTSAGAAAPTASARQKAIGSTAKSGHQSRSSVRSSRSASPNSVRTAPAVRTCRISTTSSTSSDDPELDDQRYAARGQEGDRGDAVVQDQEADELGEGVPSGHQHQEPVSTRAIPIGTAAIAGSSPSDRSSGRLTRNASIVNSGQRDQRPWWC